MIRTGRMILTVVCVVAVLSGCSILHRLSGTHNALIGEWEFKDPAFGSQKLTFNHDQTFTLDHNGDGTKDVWGSYDVVSVNRLMLRDTGGDGVADCKQTGVYDFMIRGQEVRYSVMADQCPYREQALAVVWKRVPQDPRIMERLK